MKITHRRPPPQEYPLVARENELVLALRNLNDHYPMTRVIRKSYVLSRFWAWFSQVQLSPRVRIPVPRFLTYRDP
jgi:hypothetical protein